MFCQWPIFEALSSGECGRKGVVFCDGFILLIHTSTRHATSVALAFYPSSPDDKYVAEGGGQGSGPIGGNASCRDHPSEGRVGAGPSLTGEVLGTRVCSRGSSPAPAPGRPAPPLRGGGQRLIRPATQLAELISRLRIAEGRPITTQAAAVLLVRLSVDRLALMNDPVDDIKT